MQGFIEKKANYELILMRGGIIVLQYKRDQSRGRTCRDTTLRPLYFHVFFTPDLHVHVHGGAHSALLAQVGFHFQLTTVTVVTSHTCAHIHCTNVKKKLICIFF